MDQETAKYIATYFSNLMTDEEKLAVKHTTSTLKVEHSKSKSMEV